MNTASTINIGNTAFMLICASLVMLMTPGLAFFLLKCLMDILTLRKSIA